jgi:hypothetical protein
MQVRTDSSSTWYEVQGTEYEVRPVRRSGAESSSGRSARRVGRTSYSVSRIRYTALPGIPSYRGSSRRSLSHRVLLPGTRTWYAVAGGQRLWCEYPGVRDRTGTAGVPATGTWYDVQAHRSLGGMRSWCAPNPAYRVPVPRTRVPVPPRIPEYRGDSLDAPARAYQVRVPGTGTRYPIGV